MDSTMGSILGDTGDAGGWGAVSLRHRDVEANDRDGRLGRSDLSGSVWPRATAGSEVPDHGPMCDSGRPNTRLRVSAGRLKCHGSSHIHVGLRPAKVGTNESLG